MASLGYNLIVNMLGPRYHSDQWLNEDPNRVPLHKDVQVARERMHEEIFS